MSDVALKAPSLSLWVWPIERKHTNTWSIRFHFTRHTRQRKRNLFLLSFLKWAYCRKKRCESFRTLELSLITLWIVSIIWFAPVLCSSVIFINLRLLGSPYMMKPTNITFIECPLRALMLVAKCDRPYNDWSSPSTIFAMYSARFQMAVLGHFCILISPIRPCGDVPSVANEERMYLAEELHNPLTPIVFAHICHISWMHCICAL